MGMGSLLYISRRATKFTLGAHVITAIYLVFLYLENLWFSQLFEPSIGIALYVTFIIDWSFLLFGFAGIMPILSIVLVFVTITFLYVDAYVPSIHSSLVMLRLNLTLFMLEHPLLTIVYVAVIAFGLIIYLRYLRQVEVEVR
jgi:hypothetical protein